jgi:hypothetical protein
MKYPKPVQLDSMPINVFCSAIHQNGDSSRLGVASRRLWSNTAVCLVSVLRQAVWDHFWAGRKHYSVN